MNDYTIFRKSVGQKDVWCVYYRDENGDRLNPIWVSKLKKMVYKGRQRTEPIKSKTECIKICEKSLHNQTTYNYIFRKKDKSPNFIEKVRELLDYENSPYIIGRLKEDNTINVSTISQYLSTFNTYIVKCIPPKLTLEDIEKNHGTDLTKIRDKVVLLDTISSTVKNKGLQAMRTTLEYCCSRGLIKHDYKSKLKNIKVKKGGDTDITTEETNEITSYYYTHTQKGTWERYVYLITLLSSTTGLRPCEIMGLKQKDFIGIDEENDCGVILVNHGINTDNQYSTRKNKMGFLRFLQ